MYFVIVDGKLAGFVMLTDIPELENTEIVGHSASFLSCINTGV